MQAVMQPKVNKLLKNEPIYLLLFSLFCISEF